MDPLLGKFCNNGAPRPAMLTSSNVALVQFVTDFNIISSGFNLTYQQRDGEFCKDNECYLLCLLVLIGLMACLRLNSNGTDGMFLLLLFFVTIE